MNADDPQAEIDELRLRLEEAEDTIRAIRAGDLDAFVVDRDGGQRIFTLEGADRPYRLLMERLPQGAATLDDSGAVIYANLRMSQLLNLAPEKVIGANLRDYIQCDERSRFDELLRLGLLGTVEGEFHLCPDEVPCIPVMLALGPLPEDSGARVGALVTDLTAQKHHEELAAAHRALGESESQREMLLNSERSARAEAERASRLKDDFLATLSHELRTPLNAILGWTQILRKETYADPAVDEGLAIIERNARVQSQLIADLLDMNRIMSGKMRIDMSPVHLPLVIEAALDSIRPLADAKGVTLTGEIPAVDHVVNGDASRLQQMVWNLLSNAVKFTPSGGLVRVTLTRSGDHVEIRVMDSGKGMKTEFLPHAFERFRQADSSAAREHGGLCLGLSIVKQLVDLHGGGIHAHSPGEGQGAVFTIRLLAAAADQRPAPLPGVADADAPDLAGMCVLVVDDENDSREMVRRVLEECGVTVTTASSAQEALDAAARHTFDVILSDIGMPGQDGYALIHALREGGITTPAAALTAFVRVEDRIRALAAGYQLHVGKPVEPSKLLAAVAALARDREPF